MSKPDLTFEKRLWNQGYQYVVGVDEVGRGCFAGPIVTAAVALAEGTTRRRGTTSTTGGTKACGTCGTRDSYDTSILENLGINDSKKLSALERERLAKEIKRLAVAWEVTEVGVSVINRVGIGKATEKAMRKSVRDIGQLLASKSVFVLIDGFYVKYLKGIGLKNQKGIVKGDEQSISIAAASIIAKVYRDNLMRNLSERYPHYKWAENKGYGTKEHQKAILSYGLTRFHRKQFVKTWQEKGPGGKKPTGPRV